jgi:hypothetical protein
MPRYRKKPLAQLEDGTRIYAPSPREARYRVVGHRAEVRVSALSSTSW